MANGLKEQHTVPGGYKTFILWLERCLNRFEICSPAHLPFRAWNFSNVQIEKRAWAKIDQLAAEMSPEALSSAWRAPSPYCCSLGDGAFRKVTLLCWKVKVSPAHKRLGSWKAVFFLYIVILIFISGAWVVLWFVPMANCRCAFFHY